MKKNNNQAIDWIKNLNDKDIHMNINQVTDGDYDADLNYSHQKIAKLTKK